MKFRTPKEISAFDLHLWLTGVQKNPLIIDVREESELEIATFPFSFIHLPLSKSNLWLDSIFDKLASSKEIVVICHMGVRSLDFGNWLLAQNKNYEVWNLTGGIDSWSNEIDSNLTSY
tara:strand:+ start:354 stop:707 length:354 start_codon:yes stop_codon:yes gene_type:complete